MNSITALIEKIGTASIQLTPVGGGCINRTYLLSTGSSQYFVKINSATKFPQLFETEAKGLALIAQQNQIRVPGIITQFEAGVEQFLVLEWICQGERTNTFWKQFGEQLAALHRVTQPHFGLSYANYMGSVPQLNEQRTTWGHFFEECRLLPLVKQCLDKQLLTPKLCRQFEQVIDRLPEVFNIEAPALLHGDLWSGNFMCAANGDPVLIDPAVYFGHRSIDLAMTTLFGSFESVFYEAYHYHYPLPHNYREQWKICNLYPLLIHLLLFGKGYLPQIESTLNDFQ